MKILIADKFEQSGIDALQASGDSVVFSPELSPAEIPDAVVQNDPDVLVVRGTKVTSDVFDRAKRLTLVVRAGAGYDSIDVVSASNNGIYVANCPGKNAIAVAEIAWSLILSCDRRVPDQTIDLRNGLWDKKKYSKARGLYGRTLGVVGTGTIGREVIRRGTAFGMNVVAWSRSLTAGRASLLGVTRAESPSELAACADVISINVAAKPETENLVGPEFCAAMKPGAILVNTSRGSVVDETALLQAVHEKGVRVGLDVYRNEPGGGDKSFDSKIASDPGVVGTHHVGASTDQAQEAIAREAVRVIEVYKETGVAPNAVNIARGTRATSMLIVRHHNRPGVLAHVVGEIGKAGINIEEMDNTIYEGAQAACAHIRLDSLPNAQMLDGIRKGSQHILSVDAETIAR